jgi:ABC-type transport system substrate-binding protein
VGEQKIADVFVRNARLVRINVIKKALPFEELFRMITRGEHDMVIRGWVAGPDPDISLYANFTMEPGNMNWAYYQNPELVSLLNRARVERNRNIRIKLYQTAQDIIHREVPWIPLYHLNYLIIHQSNLKNIYFNSNSYITFKDAVIENRNR